MMEREDLEVLYSVAEYLQDFVMVELDATQAKLDDWAKKGLIEEFTLLTEMSWVTQCIYLVQGVHTKYSDKRKLTHK